MAYCTPHYLFSTMSYFSTIIHHKNGPRTKHLVVKEPSFLIHLQLKKMSQAICMFGFATILLIGSSALDMKHRIVILKHQPQAIFIIIL